MKIVLATENKTKISTTIEVLDLAFGKASCELKTLELESIGPEPFGETELIDRIKVSLESARMAMPDADFYIAMEGGIVENEEYMEEVACVIVQEAKNNQFGISKAVSFQIPPVIAANVKKGMGFAEAVESYFSVKDVKQGGGFINILTNGIVTKKDLYFQPTAVALSKVLHNDWYSNN